MISTSVVVREANQFFSLSPPLVSAFFCKKTLVKVNESIGSEKHEEVACGGWRLFNGRIAYIESIEGNKTVAQWNVAFQSFRHCETGKDMVLYIQEYTYFLRVYLDVLH